MNKKKYDKLMDLIKENKDEEAYTVFCELLGKCVKKPTGMNKLPKELQGKLKQTVDYEGKKHIVLEPKDVSAFLERKIENIFKIIDKEIITISKTKNTEFKRGIIFALTGCKGIIRRHFNHVLRK